MAGLMDDAMRWLIGPRLQRRFGVFVNVLARVLVQTKPHAFVAQVDAILDASDELRFALPQVTAPTLVVTGSQDTLTPLGDAEELAELITTSRLYVLRARARAHGRGPERVQRRRLEVPRRDRPRRGRPQGTQESAVGRLGAGVPNRSVGQSTGAGGAR